jgi:uncharacterized metal-binding protein
MCDSPAIWEYSCLICKREYCSEECKRIEYKEIGKSFCVHTDTLDKQTFSNYEYRQYKR